MGKAIGAFLLAISLLFQSSAITPPPETSKNPQRYNTIYFLFDTSVSISGYADSQEAFDQTAQSLYTSLKEYDQLFDPYHNYEGLNNLKTVNDNAGGQAVPVDRTLIDLLLFCRELGEATGGRLDVTAGSVFFLWHDTLTTAILPSHKALTEAALHTGFDLLEIDEVNSTLRLTDPLARLDTSAIASGFALEQVRSSLPQGFIISLGGLVAASGTKPDGETWTVGIQDPDGESGSPLCALSMQDSTVDTCGDYERYRIINGTRYHHIIDLNTLQPTSQWRSVSILHPNAALSDGLSTALFLLSYEEGVTLAQQYGAQAMWVSADGSIYSTDGFLTSSVS